MYKQFWINAQNLQTSLICLTQLSFVSAYSLSLACSNSPSPPDLPNSATPTQVSGLAAQCTSQVSCVDLEWVVLAKDSKKKLTECNTRMKPSGVLLSPLAL